LLFQIQLVPLRRGIIPLVVKAEGDYKTQLAKAVDHAKELGLVRDGDQVVGIHALGKDSVMKVIDIHK
jgi:pyruvate kinase